MDRQVFFSKKTPLSLIVATGLLLPSVSYAENVLYFVDTFLGTDYYDIALANRGDTVTKVTDAGDFNTQLTSGAWDIVIVSENNWNNADTYKTALTAHVAAGGAVVYNNWYTDVDIDTVFESVSGSPTNQTSMTVNAAGITAGLDVNVDTMPIVLTNTGWGVFSQALTATGTGESRCDFTAGTGSCAVFANSGTTMRLGFIPDTLGNTDDDAVDFLTNAIGSVRQASIQVQAGAVTVPLFGPVGALFLSALMGFFGYRKLKA